MSLRILRQPDAATPDTACVIVPCFSTEDAGRALDLVGQAQAPSTLVRDFDPACEEPLTAWLQGVRYVFVGLAKHAAAAKQRLAFQVLSGKLRSKKYNRYVLLLSHLEHPESTRVEVLADAAVNGLLLGQYDYGLLKTDAKENHHVQIDVVCADPVLDRVIQISEAAAATQKSVYDLVNLPSSHKSAETLAEWAATSARTNGYHVEILDEHALTTQGFAALLAVNRGSEYPPRLIVSQYTGTDDPQAPLIALVGKGVLFDTGGVSLKPGDNMHLMKSDMSGAAAVLGAVDLLARLKAPVCVLACAPCTDNLIGTKAIKPGDVIGSYSGKTIEVINTDAEGRLILADALSYVVKKYSPDVVVDIATLTGSVVRALGAYCAGLFTQSDALAQSLAEAGDRCGERLWRMPLWEDYADEMKSDIADIKNLSDKPAAGSITAAKFLEHFISGHPAWAHLDIAGVAFKANGVSKTHVATAFGVRLLYEFAMHYRKH